MTAALGNDNPVKSSPVKFYYPTINQYPVDDVCRKIVLALEKHHWLFPGIKVEFDDLVDDDKDSTIYRRVLNIEGHNFKIWFCRKQGFEGSLAGWNNTAAAHAINIPQKELIIYPRASETQLYVYVNKNLKEDLNNFVSIENQSVKKYEKPHAYFVYDAVFNKPEGATSVPEIEEERLPPYLELNKKSKEEYSPAKGTPAYFTTDAIFKEFVSHLEGVLKGLSPQ